MLETRLCAAWIRVGFGRSLLEAVRIVKETEGWGAARLRAAWMRSTALASQHAGLEATKNAFGNLVRPKLRKAVWGSLPS